MNLVDSNYRVMRILTKYLLPFAILPLKISPYCMPLDFEFDIYLSFYVNFSFSR